MGGGSRFRTRQFGPVLMTDPPAPMPATFRRKQHKLHEYLQSVCMIARGQLITRRTLIKYMANKLGGAHFDRRRTPSEHAMTSLDQLETLTIDGLHPAFLELMATIQSVIASPTAMEPFRLSPTPTALFDAPSGRTEGPVQLVPRAINNLDRLADLRDD